MRQNINRCFRPSILMTCVSLIAVSAFSALGFWQLQRAELKFEIQKRFEMRLADDYQLVSELPRSNENQYLKIRMFGRYDLSREMLIDNRISKGRVGYELLTPFILESSSSIVLVNRGWLAQGEHRLPLPKTQAPLVADEIEGIVNFPVSNSFQLGEVNLDGTDIQLVPYVDLEKIQSRFDGRLAPFIVWMSAEQPGHYERNWSPAWMIPEKSEAYALQWFSFAGISLLLFIVLNFRKVE
ncbi:MAG: surfeit locus 1 family protein [Gammaproteobacteria bacterium]|jgi:surfeit locus 1 family protein